MRISSACVALTALARVRRLAEEDSAGREHVEAVEASEWESEVILGLGDGESVGEGGERVREGILGVRLREVAGRGRGDGAMKTGAAGEAMVLVSWSDMMKNWTFSLDWATRRASWRTLSGVSCCRGSEEAGAAGRLSRSGAISSWEGKGRPARSFWARALLVQSWKPGGGGMVRRGKSRKCKWARRDKVQYPRQRRKERRRKKRIEEVRRNLKKEKSEETSSGEQKNAVRGRGWFALLLYCCLVDLNMGVEFEPPNEC